MFDFLYSCVCVISDIASTVIGDEIENNSTTDAEFYFIRFKDK